MLKFVSLLAALMCFSATAAAQSYSISASPASLSGVSGQSFNMSATITSAVNLSNVNVLFQASDLAVSLMQGANVTLTNQSFTAGQPKTLTWTWSLPPETVTTTLSGNIGIYNSNWQTLTYDVDVIPIKVVPAQWQMKMSPTVIQAVPGQQISLTATVDAPSAASGINLLFQASDASVANFYGQNISYSNQSFVANLPQAYTFVWTVPSTVTPGTILFGNFGVYTAGWSTITYGVDQVQIKVVAPVATPTPSPTPISTIPSSWVTNLSPNTVPTSAGSTISLVATVTAPTAISNANLLFQISNTSVQTFYGSNVNFTGQSFAAGQTRTYSFTWTVPSNAPIGSLIGNFGVYDTSWNTQIYNVGVVKLSVAAAVAPSPTATPKPTATPSPTPTATPVPISASAMAARLGLFGDGNQGVVPGGGSQVIKEQSLEAFESWLGGPIGYGLDFIGYASWSDFTGDGGWAPGVWYAANPKRNMIWSVPITVTGTPLSAISSGAYDANFLSVATAIAAHYPNAVIRLGWEFNISGFPWESTGVETNYIAAYRRVAAIFRSVSPNFKFEWCTSIGTGNTAPQNSYPGDDVVDFIGMDYYDYDWWGLTDPSARWNYYATMTNGLNWHVQFAAAHGKPMTYPEWGAGQVGDNPYFVKQMFQWLLTNNVPHSAYWDSDVAYT